MAWVICALDALPEGRARGIKLEVEGAALALIVLRKGSRVFAYRNVCPHRGTSLDWVPDQFMSVDGAYLQCATHGALFEPETGECLAGPCRGKGLTPVAVAVQQGDVVLTQACPDASPK
jgi:nitrite reductase/ring-hydroxylating ferredoxin subunit